MTITIMTTITMEKGENGGKGEKINGGMSD